MVKKRRTPPPSTKPTRPSPVDDRRARFIAEYLIDSNATQAAIRAGYSPRSAQVTGSRLLSDVMVRAEIEKRQRKVEAKLHDRYEINADRIKRELALLGFSNMADYGVVTDDGEFRLDLTATTRDQLAAIKTVKTRRVHRWRSDDTEEEEHFTELQLHSKREALVDLGKAVGLFKDGVELSEPIRFIVERTERSAGRKSEPEGEKP